MVKRVNPINIEEKIDSGLLQNSTNFLFGEIDTESVHKIIKWIVYENTLSLKTPLTLYINSHGGSLLDAFALIEVMKKSKRKIRTVGIGSIMYQVAKVKDISQRHQAIYVINYQPKLKANTTTLIVTIKKPKIVIKKW